MPGVGLVGLSGVITWEDNVRGNIDRNLVNGFFGGLLSSLDTSSVTQELGKGNSSFIRGTSSSEDRPMARAIPIRAGTIDVHKVSVKREKRIMKLCKLATLRKDVLVHVLKEYV